MEVENVEVEEVERVEIVDGAETARNSYSGKLSRDLVGRHDV